MPSDYRDLGLEGFARFEKIRVTDEEIVRRFNLITNSGPGTLQIDPVLVVYDLAAAGSDLTIETPTFTRTLTQVSGSATDPSGPTTLISATVSTTAINGGFGTNGVRRITGMSLQVDNATDVAGTFRVSMVHASPLQVSLPLLVTDVLPADAEQLFLFQGDGSQSNVDFRGSGLIRQIDQIRWPDGSDFVVSFTPDGTATGTVDATVTLLFETQT